MCKIFARLHQLVPGAACGRLQEQTSRTRAGIPKEPRGWGPQAGVWQVPGFFLNPVQGGSSMEAVEEGNPPAAVTVINGAMICSSSLSRKPASPVQYVMLLKRRGIIQIHYRGSAYYSAELHWSERSLFWVTLTLILRKFYRLPYKTQNNTSYLMVTIIIMTDASLILVGKLSLCLP